MRVLLFGRYGDAAGWSEREVVGPATLNALVAELGRAYPELNGELGARYTFITRNREGVIGDAPLSPGDEVAFMPPMSGG